jgi:hypothetical protein
MSRVVTQGIAILGLLPTCVAQRLHACSFSGRSGALAVDSSVTPPLIVSQFFMKRVTIPQTLLTQSSFPTTTKGLIELHQRDKFIALGLRQS